MPNRTTRSCCFAVGRVLFLVALGLPFACGHTEQGNDVTPQAGTSGAGSGAHPIDAGANTTGGRLQDPPDSPAAGAPPTVRVPGTSDRPQILDCGAVLCESTPTLLPTVFVDPCCAADGCGVSSEVLSAVGASFAEKCQAKAQPGVPNDACPRSPPRILKVGTMTVGVAGFAGCCRAETGTCGVLVDDLMTPGFGTFAQPGLGCVDSAPFFEQVPGASCGPANGEGGAAGAGGAASGGAATGGAGAEQGGEGGI